MGVFVILLFFVVVGVVLLLYGTVARVSTKPSEEQPMTEPAGPPARFKVLCRDGCCTRSRKYCDRYSKINYITLGKKIIITIFTTWGIFLRGRGLEKNVFVCVCRALSVRLPDSRRVSYSNYGIMRELENDEKKNNEFNNKINECS